MRRQAGFTLLETLVAVVVLGLLMTGLSQALQVGVAASRAQFDRVDHRGDLEAAERALRAMVERMEPGGVSGHNPLFVGEAAAMAFTTTLPLGAGPPDSPPVDVRLELDRTGQLVLLWTPHWEVRLQPAPAPERVVLIEDVARLELAYWAVDAGAWQAPWTGRVLPKLIRIRLGFAPGSGRRAPDIVVAPMRDRWRS